MKPLRAGGRQWSTTAGALLGYYGLVLACSTDVVLDLEGKRCREAEPRCVSGYMCRSDGICVRPEDLQTSGAAGVSSSGTGGTSAGSAAGGAGGQGTTGGQGNAGAAGSDAGGSSGAGGSSAAGSSGTAGSSGSVDAGPDASADAAPGDTSAGLDSGAPNDASTGVDACVPVVVYEDSDGDGYGRTDVSTVACPGPGLAETPGDCRDDLPEVNPGQLQYFGVGYADPTAPDDISFDYDCSDNETADPSNSPTTTAPNCGALAVCSGTGYQPTTRSGAGILALCGSSTQIACTGTLLPCNSVPSTITPFRCR